MDKSRAIVAFVTYKSMGFLLSNIEFIDRNKCLENKESTALAAIKT